MTDVSKVVVEGHTLRSVVGLLSTRLQSTGIITLLVLMIFVFFAIINPRFTNSINLINILNQSSYLTLVALGQGLVLISGGFDLAIAGVVGLTSVITASLLVFLEAHGGEPAGGTHARFDGRPHGRGADRLAERHCGRLYEHPVPDRHARRRGHRCGHRLRGLWRDTGDGGAP